MKNIKIDFWVWVIIVFAFYAIHVPMGLFSGWFFETLDRIMYLSPHISPVSMWAVLGLLIGTVYGTFVSVRKYNLSNWLIALPVGALIIIINIILFASYVLA